MVESRLPPLTRPGTLTIPCVGPGLQAPEGEARRCVEGFVIAVPWRDLAEPEALPGRLFRAAKWIVSILSQAEDGSRSMAFLCPGCAEKAYPPEVLEAAKKELEK